MTSRVWWNIPFNTRLWICAIVLVSMFGSPFWALRLGVWAWLPSLMLLVSGVLLRIVRLSLRIVVVTIAFCGWCGVLFVFCWITTGLTTAADFQHLQAVFSASAYVLVAGLWVIGGCRLTEWLDVAGRSSLYGLRLQDILATNAGAAASRSLGVQQQIDAFFVTRHWAEYIDPTICHETAFRRCVRWLGNRCEFFFVLVAELVGGISLQLKGDNVITTFARESRALRLSELYDLPRFGAFYKAIFSERPIAPQWLETISQTLTHGSSVVDLGAGTGRLSAVLVDLAFDVSAIECNPTFAHDCQTRLAETTVCSQWAVFQGAFPKICPPRRMDAVILHQNVILELINEMTSAQLWTALRAIIVPGGKILFDYPENYEVQPDGRVKTIVSNLESDNTRFAYAYQYVGKSADMHLARLFFSATTADLEIIREPYLRVSFPSLDSVLADAAEFGFGIERKINLSEFSFFPGEMKLLVLRSLE